MQPISFSVSEEHFLALGSISDPGDGDVAFIFDELDVVLGVGGQISE